MSLTKYFHPIESNTGLEMSPFVRNISFHSINLVGLLRHDLAKCSEVFQEVVNLLRKKIAKPIHPTTIMPFSQIEEGFRLMQMGKHIGKIVFEVGEEDLVPVSYFSSQTVSSKHPKADQYLDHSCWYQANYVRPKFHIPP